MLWWNSRNQLSSTNTFPFQCHAKSAIRKTKKKKLGSLAFRGNTIIFFPLVLMAKRWSYISMASPAAIGSSQSMLQSSWLDTESARRKDRVAALRLWTMPSSLSMLEGIKISISAGPLIPPSSQTFSKCFDPQNHYLLKLYKLTYLKNSAGHSKYKFLSKAYSIFEDIFFFKCLRL